MFEVAKREIALCEQHLVSLEQESRGYVEHILVGYVLTLVYAEFEKVIRESLYERCRSTHDSQLNGFVEWCIERVVRSIAIGDLTGILKRFDSANGDEFLARISAVDSRPKDSFDSIRNNRQAIAHKASVTVKMDEVAEWFVEAQKVILEFRHVLRISRLPSGNPAL